VEFTRTRVNILVSQAISEGSGLSSLQKSLREDIAFSPDRASVVARTETATALGQGHKQAAIIQGLGEKRWITQGDDDVDTGICDANARQGWVKTSDPFASGHDTIPGHPNCRCTVLYRTADVPDDIHALSNGHTPGPVPGHTHDYLTRPGR
jgi:uncharacterized protein with gpF-like domain